MSTDPNLRRSLLARLDRATAAHKRTRAALEAVVADCHAAGIPYAEIAEHSDRSKEWARKVATSVLKAREVAE